MGENQTRSKYSNQFKIDAVELSLRSNKTVIEIAEDLGIRVELLYRWKSEYQAKQKASFPDTGHLKEPETEKLRKLERELRSVKKERDIQKKALAGFSRTTL